MQKLTRLPATTWDAVHVGDLIEVRRSGKKRSTFIRVARAVEAEAPENRPTCQYIYGEPVRKNGSPSTAPGAVFQLLHWLHGSELVAIHRPVVDLDRVHAEAWDEDARRSMDWTGIRDADHAAALVEDAQVNEWRRFPELVEEQLAKVAAEDAAIVVDMERSRAAIVADLERAHLASRWTQFLDGQL